MKWTTIRKTIFLVLVALFFWWVHANFSPLQQKSIFSTTDRILVATAKDVDKIKDSILLIKNYLQTNYIPADVVEVREEVVRNLVPYLQCPVVECQSKDPLCSYNNPQVDERWCVQSCGELSCSCDQVVCFELPSYCSYPNKIESDLGCLLECGEPVCECPIESCPNQWSQCFTPLRDDLGCIAQCVPSDCPLA